MKKILLLMILLPNLASAYTLKMIQGISIYTINGDKVASQFSDSYQILAGKNQIAVRYDGKLSAQGKSQHFQSKPYLLTFTAKSDLKLTTVSKKYKELVPLEQQGMAIFKMNTDTVTFEQTPLPATSKALPYANIALLVTQFNEKNGIYFGGDGLEKLSESALEKQQKAKHSRVVAQLKYWYSQASIEEIKAFEKWKKNN